MAWISRRADSRRRGVEIEGNVIPTPALPLKET